MSSLFRRTLALRVSFIVFLLASILYWEHGVKYGIVLSGSWKPGQNAGQEDGGFKYSERILLNRSDILCSSGSYTLQTSEPLDTAIGQLNKLLSCVATEILGLPTKHDTQAHGINHASVLRCFKDRPGSNSSCELHDVYNYQNTSNEGKLNRNTVRRAIGYNHKLEDYFKITHLEPLVFDLILSWKPYQRDNWQLDWPFRDFIYYAQRRISHTCTLNSTKVRSVNITGTNNEGVGRSSHQGDTKLDGLPDECKDSIHVSDHPKPAPKPTDFLHHPIYVHIIRHGTVSVQGYVRVGSTEIIPTQCKEKHIHVPGTASQHYKQIFVISQFWGEGFFHANIEDLPRLTPYLEFLRQHPEIKIHAKTSSLKRNLHLLGLDPKRLISGQVKADVIYLPQGGGCGHFHPIAVRLLYRQYVLYIQNRAHGFNINAQLAPDLKQASQLRLSTQNPTDHTTGSPNNLKSTDIKENSVQATHLNLTLQLLQSQLTHQNIPIKEFQPASIILIQRSTKRWLAQHQQVKALLEGVAQKKNLKFEVFTDHPLPDFNHTVVLFSQAKLVVAPHGAGLANLLVSPSDTRVVEILCNPRPNLCYKNLHATLGQPYVGLLSVKPGKCGPLYVDLMYLKLVVFSLLDN